MSLNIKEDVVIVEEHDIAELMRHWKWLCVLGILTITVGVAAIILPRMAAYTIELTIGGLLIIDGVFQLVQTLRLGKMAGLFWRLMNAALSLVVGILLLVFPMEGVLTLALVLGLFFLLGAAFKGLLAYQMRSLGGTGWLAFSAALSAVLGVLVLFLWPQAAPWILSLLVGVNLIFAGWWLFLLGLQIKALQP